MAKGGNARPSRHRFGYRRSQKTNILIKKIAEKKLRKLLDEKAPVQSLELKTPEEEFPGHSSIVEDSSSSDSTDEKDKTDQMQSDSMNELPVEPLLVEVNALQALEPSSSYEEAVPVEPLLVTIKTLPDSLDDDQSNSMDQLQDGGFNLDQTSSASDAEELPSDLSSGPKKWSPGAWQDGHRKSAFQPYKQAVGTVLTNLQRGNTQAETPVPQEADINFHSRAGQGEITESDIKSEEFVDVCDGEGLTALHWAAAYGQISTVQLLIKNGAKIDKLGPEGETPLLLAANGGHHDVVRLLLNEGAAVNHTDDVGNTALMYAGSANHPHCCNELLLRGADVTMVNHCDDSAYSLAVDYNSNLALAVIENYLLTLLGSS